MFVCLCDSVYVCIYVCLCVIVFMYVCMCMCAYVCGGRGERVNMK